MDVFASNAATSAEDAAKITPRAEFRVFGQGVIDVVKAAMWKAKAQLFKVRTSGETYFVSEHTSEANVKVRDGLLDIKTLVGVTENGYEIFQPRGKFQFPVPAGDVARILESMRLSAKLDAETYTLDDFMALIGSLPDAAAVEVRKKRYGFSVEGTICEFAEVLFNGALLESACCESEDYEGMKKAIGLLGLENMKNTNYLKAAKQVIGMK